MNVNILLFDDFETLDAFGLIEIFGRISEFSMVFFSMEGGIITSRQGTKIMTNCLSEIDYAGILMLYG